MSGFLLDTNIPSETIRARPEPKVQTWLAAQPLDTLFLSAITFGELRNGIALRMPGQRRTELETWIEGDLSRLFAARTLTVTRSIAERWGVLDAKRQRAGTPGMADALIAATALEHGLTLVTRNVKDFDGIGVALLNPWEAMLTNRRPGATKKAGRPMKNMNSFPTPTIKAFVTFITKRVYASSATATARCSGRLSQSLWDWRSSQSVPTPNASWLVRIWDTAHTSDRCTLVVRPSPS